MAIIDKDNNQIDVMPNDYVTLTEAGNVLEIQYVQKRNTKATVKKISKDEYVVLSTGEIKQSIPGHSRDDNKTGLYKTFKRLRYLVNANFFGAKNELFITLTYAENMTDTVRLRKDFESFAKRLKRKYPGFDYLICVEPQARLAWHIHCLIKWPELKSIYIPNSVLADLWGHGFVKVERIQGVDNLGAYLTAYLTDIPVDQSNSNSSNIVEKNVGGTSKKFIKGGRLGLYPKNMKYYRHSRGIKEPRRILMKYSDAQKKVSQGRQTFNKNIFVEGDNFSNAIKFEQYNLR